MHYCTSSIFRLYWFSAFFDTIEAVELDVMEEEPNGEYEEKNDPQLYYSERERRPIAQNWNQQNKQERLNETQQPFSRPIGFFKLHDTRVKDRQGLHDTRVKDTQGLHDTRVKDMQGLSLIHI